MTSALVTGGSGFIGSHLVDALLRRGDRVCIRDDFRTGSWDHLDAARGRVEVFESEITDLSAVRQAVRGVKVTPPGRAGVAVAQRGRPMDDALHRRGPHAGSAADGARRQGAAHGKPGQVQRLRRLRSVPQARD